MDPASGVAVGVELLKSGRKPMFMILTACATMIAIAKYGLLQGRVNDFANENLPWFYVGTFAACAFFVWDGGSLLVDAIKSQLVAKRMQSSSVDTLEKQISSLTQNEQALLWEFIRRGVRVLQVHGTAPELEALVRWHLVRCERGYAMLGFPGEIRCAISDDAWNYLQESRRAAN